MGLGRYIWTPVVGGRKMKPVIGRGKWLDPIQKWHELASMMHESIAIGGDASEVLAVGGTARIAWVDLDTDDSDLVGQWIDGLQTQSKSVVATRSTTNFHLYVRLCSSLLSTTADVKQWLRATMEPKLYCCVGGVAVPESYHRIYLPRGPNGRGILPQDLVKECPQLTNL